jgi:hypothetical protein
MNNVRHSSITTQSSEYLIDEIKLKLSDGWHLVKLITEMFNGFKKYIAYFEKEV